MMNIRADYICDGNNLRFNKQALPVFLLIKEVILTVLAILFMASAAGASNFVDNNDGTVTDNDRGLIWMKEGNAGPWGALGNNLLGAGEYCDKLVFAGSSDWRLPTKEELESIIDKSVTYPDVAIYRIFVELLPTDYWTFTTDSANVGKAWVVEMAHGTSYTLDKIQGYAAVRCVRNGVPLTIRKYGNSTDAVIADYVSEYGDPVHLTLYDTFNARQYINGTKVTLSAKAGSSSTFGGWIGEGCTGTGPCELTMTQARNVTANFDTWSSIDGSCGSDNGLNLTATPSELCKSGEPSLVSGKGPWTWTCNGVRSGKTTNCSADIGYIDLGNSIVVDVTTQLFWQQKDDGIERTWNDAISYCSGLSIADHDDWRLPSADEHQTMLIRNGMDLFIMIRSVNRSYLFGLFPIDFLTTTMYERKLRAYWSSKTDVDNQDKAKIATYYLYNGIGTTQFDESRLKTEKHLVRCVRQSETLKNLLSIKKSGHGKGSVIPNVGAISWDISSSNLGVLEIDKNAVVTLTAIADAKSVFAGWTGESCTGTDTCQVAMTKARSVTATFYNKQEITVTRHTPASMVFQGSFNVAASADSGLAVAISTSGSCSGSGTGSATITMTNGTGVCTVHYNQPGDTVTYGAAPEVTESTAAQKRDGTIDVYAHAPATATAGERFFVKAMLLNWFTWSSLQLIDGHGPYIDITTTGACTGSGINIALITMTGGTGKCTVHYNAIPELQTAGNIPEVLETTTTQKMQSIITVSMHAPANKAYPDSFFVMADDTAGIGVNITTTGSCSGSGQSGRGSGGAFITMTSGIGTCTVHYNLIDNDYFTAPEVTESTTAQKVSAQILVFDHAPASLKNGEQFYVSAANTRGLDVAITTSGVCSGSGTGAAVITMTGSTGVCTVHYNQVPNDNVTSSEVTETTTVQMGTQAIAVTQHAPAYRQDNTSFTVSATAGSGLGVAISTSGVCSGSGTNTATITPTGATGTCKVRYNQSGDANYSSAPEVVESTYIPGAIMSPPGNALSFDGSTASVNLGSSSALNLSGAFTIEAWVNPTQKSSISTLVGHKNSGSGNPGYAFYINSWNTTDAKLVFETEAVSMATTNAAITWGVWQHVAATWDGTSFHFYVNGVEQPSTGSVNLTSNSNNVYLGAVQGSYYRYQGQMDEVRIWSTVRSQAQILANMNRILTGSESGLAAYYQFDQKSGTSLPDLTGNASGTVSSGATWISSGALLSDAAPAGLVAWWGGDGDALDRAGSNHGTLMGGATYAPGKVGQAFKFDGVDDYLRIPDNIINNLNSSLTFNVWFKSSSGGVILGYQDKEIPTVPDWYVPILYIGNDGYLHAEFISIRIVANNAIVNDDLWHNAAVTAGGGVISLYLDGTLVSSVSGEIYSYSMSKNQFGFGWGTGDLAPPSFNGLIDEPQIYNRVLTGAEIAALYNAQSAGTKLSCKPQPSGMVAWLRGEQDATDAAGTNHGTLMNGTTYAAGKVRQAFQFDGADDRLNIPDNIIKNLNGILSFNVWFKSSAGGVILGYQNSSVSQTPTQYTPVLYIGTDGKLYGGFYTTANTQIVTGTTVNDGLWHNAAVTADGTTISLFLDGAFVGSRAGTVNNFSQSKNQIGAGYWFTWLNAGSGWSYFNGVIDEVQIYNRSLTAAEIAAIYNAQGFGVCYTPDSAPDAFLFTTQTDAALNAVLYSDTIIVSGINAPAPVTVTGGEYSINSGAWQSASGTVNNGDTVRVRQTSSDMSSTLSNLVLSIGGVSAAFSVKTLTLPLPTLTTPAVSNIGANMATLALQSSTDGTGYFTLHSGSGVTCGTGDQVKAGVDGNNIHAVQSGTLLLKANISGSYTTRNLIQNTAYTLCFTADNNGSLQTTPVSSGFSTTAEKIFSNPVWTTVGSAGFSAGGVNYISLAMSPDGTPYIAYKDGAGADKATVMKYANGDWTTVGSAGFSAGGVNYISLAMSPDGTLYIAYKDGVSGGKATVMKYANGDWTTVGSMGFSAGQAEDISLAFGPDGTPYVAYMDWGNGYKATVMKYANGDWTTVGNAGFSAVDVYYTSLAFGPDGTPYVAYMDGANGWYKATVMKYANGDWTTVGSAGFSAGRAGYMSLSMSPDGTPYVAYQDWGNGYKATVMKYANGDWTAVGSAGFSAGRAEYVSLSMSPDGTPYVAYMDGANGWYKATVMKYANGDWTTVGSAGFSAGRAGYMSLSMSPDGTPYVAYQDGANSQKATIMQLISATAPSAVTNTASAIATNRATLNGMVSANVARTTASFEYGFTTGYGSTAPASQGPIEAGVSNASVSTDLPGLACNTTYHFRVKAVNSLGTTFGNDQTFTTAACLPEPQLTTPVITSVGVNMATFAMQSSTDSTGYFTLHSGSGIACGTGDQVKAGVNSHNAPAFRSGFISLAANIRGSYTVRNLIQNTAYTVCFTADNKGSLQTTPMSAGFSTTGTVLYNYPTWIAVGSAGFSPSTAAYTSFAVSSDGTPYIAYQDHASSDKATVMKYVNGAWTTVGSAGFSAGWVNYTTLGFGPDGILYAAYQDGANSQKTTVMKYVNGAWTVVGSAGFSAGDVYDISLAFGQDGTPYVAYKDGGSGYRATVMKYVNGTWTVVGSAGFSAGIAAYTSMELSPDGTPYVVYADGGNDYRATVMRYANGVWTSVGSAGLSAGWVNYTTLGFGPDGTPYVAYQDGANSQKTTVMKYANGTWTVVGSAGFSAGYINNIALSFGPDGTPYVVYTDGGNDYRATVMKYANGTWTLVGSAGFSAGLVNYTTLGFGPDGTPYVAYQDGANDQKATVMQLIDAPPLISGNALKFNGTDSYVELGQSDAIALTSGAFTIEAWINPTQKSSISTIVGHKSAGGGNPGYAFYINSWNTMDAKLVFETEAVSMATTNAAVTWGVWQHVAAAWDGTNFHFYVNGVEQPSTGSVNLTSNNQPVYLGSILGQYFFYEGLMDEVRIWNTARSQDQISADMNNVLTGNESGLAANYRFDQLSGVTLPDLTGNAINGTISANATWTASGMPLLRAPGNALQFNGTGSYVELGQSDAIALTGGAFTIEAWINPTQKSSISTIVGHKSAGGGNPGYAFYINSWNTTDAKFVFETEAVSMATTNAAVTWGVWQHVAAAWDGTNFHFYVNGVEQPSTGSVNLTGNSQPVYLGSILGQYFFYEGLMDEVRIWNTARSQDQIYANMSYEFTGSENGLIAYYRFDQLSGVTLPDLTGNGNTGALMNGPVWTPGEASVFSPAPPAAATVAATGIAADSATLNGTVSSNGASTVISFEYGLTTNYGSTATAVQSPLASDAVNTAVSAGISGLSRNTTYHFRVKAVNSLGTTFGSDQTFTTAMSSPTLTIPVIFSPGANMATLVLQSDADITGYFTLHSGSGVACGTGDQVKAGADSHNVPAFRSGFISLAANIPGNYTVRNLIQNTAYTVCFTADNRGSLQTTPVSAGFSTTAAVVYNNSAGWSPVGSAGLSDGQAAYISLAISPEGTPYIAYQDHASGDKATVMKYVNGAWTTVGSAGLSNGWVNYTTLAFGPDGTPYVAYQDGANSQKATVMKYANGDWTIVGSSGFSAGDVYDISLSFGPDGTPYVAYTDGGSSYRATVMTYTNGAWTVVGSAGFSAETVAYTSLAISPEGTLYIAYQDHASSYKATVMKYVNGAWTTVGSAGLSNGWVNYTTLAFGPDGTPYVAYQDGANSQKATVMKYVNGDWTIVGNSGFSAGDVYDISLSFGPDGTPYVAYTDGGSGYRATVMMYTNGAWTTVGSAGFSAGTATYISLSFGPDGAPFTAYLDYSNSYKATVMKLINYSPSTTIETGQLVLLLEKGWNFISTPKQPSNALINVVLNDIAENIKVVWGYDNHAKKWQKYKGQGSSSTGQGQNTLTAIEAGKGYWIYMNEAASLTIPYNLSTIQPLNLFVGWNLVGYSGTDNKDITQGLGADVDGKWSVIWNWAGGVWKAKKASDVNADLKVQELTAFNQGRAYWIKMKLEAEWTQ